MKVTMEFDLPKDSEVYQEALTARDVQKECRRLQRAGMSISILLSKCQEQGKSLEETAARVNWFIDCVFFRRELNEDAYNQALNRDMEK